MKTTLLTGRDIIDELIENLEKEKLDAKETKNSDGQSTEQQSSGDDSSSDTTEDVHEG
jgi:hypothetical protein